MTDASSQPGPEAEAGTDPRAAGGADPGPSASTGGSPEAGADPGILCANCGRPRAERFCPVCGQNDRTYTRSLLPVLGELVRESFEFDGRLAQTLKLLLFKPGSLSTEFSRNRRARYMTPVRLYLFSSVIFFLTMSVAMSLAPNPLDQDMALNGASSSLGEIPGDVVDSMEAAVPRLQVRMGDDSVATGRNARAAEADVEAFKAGIGPVQRERLDDVLARDPDDLSRILLTLMVRRRAGEAADDTTGGPAGESPAEPDAQPGPPGFASPLAFLERAATENTIDLLHDPGAFLDRALGNLSIAMFFLMPVYAFMLAVLYWRKKRYYIEHLVFGMHVHSFFFLVSTLMLLASLTPVGLVAQSLTQGGLGLVMVAYPIIALRRFYRDGWILTLVKAFVLGFLYAVIVSPLTSVVLFLTA